MVATGRAWYANRSRCHAGWSSASSGGPPARCLKDQLFFHSPPEVTEGKSRSRLADTPDAEFFRAPGYRVQSMQFLMSIMQFQTQIDTGALADRAMTMQRPKFPSKFHQLHLCRRCSGEFSIIVSLKNPWSILKA